MVECTALEMRHTRKGIGGSNPSLSANGPSDDARGKTLLADDDGQARGANLYLVNFFR